MGLAESDVIDDGDGGGGGGSGDGGDKSLSSSNVSCSICLEPVTDTGDRSLAKLICGHEFHLDCIGSAFNIKGSMQCPNCRKIEKGQWLFSSACRSVPDFNFDDWHHDDDVYELGYSEMSFGVQWCPITAFPRISSSFEDGEFPSSSYHDLMGQHAVFAEHTAVSSSSHPCPYVAYYGPVHSSSSSSVGSVSDASNFNAVWGGPSGSSEIPTPYTIPTLDPVDPLYHSWEHHSLPFSATSSRLSSSDQPSVPAVTQRSSRANSDLPRPGSFVPPFIAGHSSGARVGSSVTSSMIPPYPGSAARARDRVQALQAYFQPPSTSPPMRTPVMPHARRSNSHRGPPQVGPMPPVGEQMGQGGLYFFPSATPRSFPEAENPMNSRFHGWDTDHSGSFPFTPAERESGWGVFHQAAGGSGTFRQRHGSERTPSQSRS